MSKGYRTKVNGVYTDEMGWCGYEVIGFSVMPFCVGKCGETLYQHAAETYSLVGPMEVVCGDCLVEYCKEHEIPLE